MNNLRHLSLDAWIREIVVRLPVIVHPVNPAVWEAESSEWQVETVPESVFNHS